MDEWHSETIIEWKREMASSFLFNNFLVAVATVLVLAIMYLTRLGANKAVLAICSLLGLANIFIGYRYISMVDTFSGNPLLTAKDVSTAADIKMWSAALALLGVGALFCCLS